MSNESINTSLNELFECDDMGTRMKIVDEILTELELTGINHSDFEDDIRDLSLD